MMAKFHDSLFLIVESSSKEPAKEDPRQKID